MFLVDWAVKMRIRPPEFKTSICDAKYHISLALSVIPRRSWGDVARRFTMIRWAVHSRLPSSKHTPPPPPPPRVGGILSGRFDEENPFVQNSSVLLVQANEGVSVLVMDRIGDIYHSLPRRADVIVTTVGARHKCQQDRLKRTKIFGESHGAAAHGGAPPRAMRASDRAPDVRRSAEAATSFAQGLRGDAPLITRHWSHDAGRSLACRLCARRAEAMRCSAARNATPRNFLHCWMHDAAGPLLRIIVRCCAAPTPPAARRLCDAGSLMCARPCARMRSCCSRDLVGGGRRPAAAPASLRRYRDGWSDSF
ncbi:hypothetical protein F511_44839 [Dorcoceras hygrometricum]|uniref:Uncharacterized protein n=1 Tax=Dorcoceras hygrometricum TaxID=472368 RepID=A0A2Z7A4W6_9LAMI|nr:hypothetical protein F511_44839 [Dorcoceras hygrometricum]